VLDIEALVKAVVSRDTERSQQVDIGPSEVGLCRRKTWYRLRGQEATNAAPYRWSAFMGTAIHTGIEDAIAALDPEGLDLVTEIEVTGVHNGTRIVGHVDLYVPEHALVLDWKTILKSKRRYFPTQSMRYQVHLYAWLLNQAGHEVTHVAVVGMCRDGNEDDFVVHCEPKSHTVLDAAFAWIDEAVGEAMPPADQTPHQFCRRYCQYYDSAGVQGCAGKP
jgi:CRISPR/Cas system-associated exonuclease Cas4 (RecB family)